MDIVERLRGWENDGWADTVFKDARLEIERLQKLLTCIAKHPDTPELIRQYAAGMLQHDET